MSNQEARIERVSQLVREVFDNLREARLEQRVLAVEGRDKEVEELHGELQGAINVLVAKFREELTEFKVGSSSPPRQGFSDPDSTRPDPKINLYPCDPDADPMGTLQITNGSALTLTIKSEKMAK